MRDVKKIGAGLLSAVAISMAVAGCGSPSQLTQSTKAGQIGNASTTQKQIKVALIPKEIGIPYFTGADQGAQLVANRLHISLTYNGPTTASASDQVSMINSYVAQGYNVIAVSANDPTSLAPALKAAMQRGVKVITWDSDVIPSARQYFVDQATAEGIGSTLVEITANHFKGQKNVQVGILSSTPTNPNQNSWIAVMKKVIASKYPNLHIVTIQYDQEQPDVGLTAAENMIKAYPNMKAIISPDSVGVPAAAEAVEKLGLKGKIYVTGLADPIQMKQYVNDGTVQQFVLWNVPELGELTMYVARALADGTMPTSGEFKAGGLGTFKVQDHTVLLGNPTVFTKASTDKANY
ncbi:monosaccharide ABC transporter substrate-binding protein (CUT2 family) [Alicyclobacillus sacchari]|uniref:Autoinducer 2-binding protein LsrB n=1 Tax=Alicyclobacillus sacchari TaxID=392010 RepID=A0A4R8LHB8_9BACL|nr:substrate-binding domain-containing protein [Alicyclobacillus sacchari]TDY42580.1 monosaccharide ABC transporter substrate-binding protein (CUT2 family) [Alicyclobacillus sacchari]GMA58119.1 autoinducer 2-binding protein LsrB [Alicyclobacillus sacchari]